MCWKENYNTDVYKQIVFSIFSEREAAVMKANSWLYHYYMVQSRLQYSLAYGGQSPTSLAAFYPGSQLIQTSELTLEPHELSLITLYVSGMPNSASFHGQSPFDGHMLHASFMASPQGGVSHYSGYAGYTPPPGAYNLHQHYQQHHVDQRSSDSPLDFSTAAHQYGTNSSWNESNYEDTKVVGFTDINTNGMDRSSSPDYR